MPGLVVAQAHFSVNTVAGGTTHAHFVRQEVDRKCGVKTIDYQRATGLAVQPGAKGRSTVLSMGQPGRSRPGADDPAKHPEQPQKRDW